MNMNVTMPKFSQQMTACVRSEKGIELLVDPFHKDSERHHTP